MSQPATSNAVPPPAAEPAAVLPPGQCSVLQVQPGFLSPKVRLIAASVLLVGWFTWLIVTALTKNQGPIISRSQAAVTEYVVIAELERSGPTMKATVHELLWEAHEGKGPRSGTVIHLVNGGDTDPAPGTGRYLLLLTSELPGSFEATAEPQLAVAPVPRPPDSNFSAGPKPRIYPWRDSLRKQVKALWPNAR